MEAWIYLALGSAFFFALKDWIAKKEFKKKIEPLQLVFEEYFLLFFLMILFIGLVQFGSFIEIWSLYLAKSFLLGVSTWLYFELLKKYEISLVGPLLNLNPLFVLIFSYLFLFEGIVWYKILGIVVLIVSTYVLELTVHHHKKKKGLNVLHFKILKSAEFGFYVITILMVLCLSLTSIIDRIIFVSGANVYTNMFFTALISFCVLVIYYIKENYLMKALKKIVKEPSTLWIGFFTIVSNFFILDAISIPTAKVSLVIPLRRTSSILDVFFGRIFLHEHHFYKRLLSIFFMLIGVVLIVI